MLQVKNFLRGEPRASDQKHANQVIFLLSAFPIMAFPRRSKSARAAPPNRPGPDHAVRAVDTHPKALR